MLVVDDDDSLRLLCRVNLELEGYRVLEARTVATADEVLRSDDVDVVLLDVHLGGEDGLALVDEIRTKRPAARVALFTGSIEVDAARREPVDAVLTKPFTLEELSGTVGRLAAATA